MSSHARDVFAYGIVLLQLLTDQVALGNQFEMHVCGVLLAQGIDKYLEENDDFEKFIKQPLLE